MGARVPPTWLISFTTRKENRPYLVPLPSKPVKHSAEQRSGRLLAVVLSKILRNNGRNLSLPPSIKHDHFGSEQADKDPLQLQKECIKGTGLVCGVYLNVDKSKRII